MKRTRITRPSSGGSLRASASTHLLQLGGCLRREVSGIFNLHLVLRLKSFRPLIKPLLPDLLIDLAMHFVVRLSSKFVEPDQIEAVGLLDRLAHAARFQRE